MTDSPMMGPDVPLPGLGGPGDITRGASSLYVHVQRSLRYLSDQGLVDERHAGIMALALELAQTIRSGERAYGVAQAAAQLLACFDKLLPAPEGGDPDGFDQFRAYLAGVGDAGGTS